MRGHELNFPYPVIGMGDSVLGDAAEVRATSHIPERGDLASPYRWEFEIAIKNHDVLSLIAEGRAEYLCEVMCSATLLRTCFRSATPTVSVELGRRDVNGRVTFDLYVVTKERLLEYRNADANPDYAEIGSFDVPKFAPLAVLNSYHWDADLCYEDLTSLRSILQIVENTACPNEQFVMLNTDGDYIKLLLPSAQYKAFLEAANAPGVVSVLHSTLVLYALQVALLVYRKEQSHRWERALSIMVQRCEACKDLSIDEPGDASMIAMRLLDNPFRRLCEILPSLAAGAASATQGASDAEDESSDE